MSAYLCQTPTPDAGYPPVQESALDQASEQQIAALQAASPFGFAKLQVISGSKATGYTTSYKDIPVTSARYEAAMDVQIGAAKKLDFKWPFWAGLGLGVAGIALLAIKRR